MTRAIAARPPVLTRIASGVTATRSVWSTLVLAGLVFTASWLLAAQSFFISDDFLLARYLTTNPLDLETLTRSWFGHLMPGYILADGLFVNAFGLSWPLASIVIAAVNAGAAVAVVRILDAVVGRVRLNLAIALAFSFSVGVLMTRLWWAATINNMLALALGLAALGGLTRWLTRGRASHLVGALLLFALALAVSEKTLLFAVYAVLWSVLVVWRGRPWRDRVRLLVRAWPAWVGIAVLCGVDVVVFITGPYVDESGAAPGIATTVAFVAWGVAGGFIPSLFGMDLQSLQPGWGLAAVLVSCAVVLGAVVLSLRRRPVTGGPWLFAASVVIIATAVLSRRGDLLGLEGARILRYHLEATALVWLAIGVIVYTVLVPTAGAARRTVTHGRTGSRTPVRLLAGISVVAFAGSLALWAPTVAGVVQLHPGTVTRAWADALVQSYPESRPPLLNVTVPDFVVIDGLAPFNRGDAVLPFILGDVSMTDELGGAWAVADDGRAGPAVFVPHDPDIAVDACDTGLGIPIADAAAKAGEFLMFDFSESAPGAVLLNAGGSIERTITSASGQLVVELTNDLERGTLLLVGADGPLCIDRMQIGDVVAG